jgi:isoquinoline 1-oxidoreductase alpha subunit
MSAVGLLSENAKPSVEDIDDYMDGNACRCATYQRIRAAIQRASEMMEV